MANASRWPLSVQLRVLSVKGVSVMESLLGALTRRQGLPSRVGVGRGSPRPLQGSARYRYGGKKL